MKTLYFDSFGDIRTKPVSAVFRLPFHNPQIVFADMSKRDETDALGDCGV
jgi:hypothetical protein